MGSRLSELTTAPAGVIDRLRCAEEGRFPVELVCSACGERRPLALAAFARDYRMLVLCVGCCAEHDMLRAVAALIQPAHPTLGDAA